MSGEAPGRDTPQQNASQEDVSQDEQEVEGLPAESAELTDFHAALEALVGEDAILGSDFHDGITWVRVSATNWLNAAIAAKRVGFSFFSFLSGFDWLPNPELNGEKFYATDHVPKSQEVVLDDKVRRGGGSSRFQVFARVANPDTHGALIVTADLEDDLTVPTWSNEFKGADWHERETHEMFGFHFAGHQGLRPIYLSGEFVGFPLRKDFVLAARILRPWPGLVNPEDMPKKDEPDASAAEPKAAE